MNAAQQKAIAMIAEETSCGDGVIIFREGQRADAFYLLLDGCVDLYFTPLTDTSGGSPRDKILVGEINPAEPFGLSALVEPYVLTLTAQASGPSRLLKIDAPALRALCDEDDRMGYVLMRQTARALAERLLSARLQLAAARA
jgi:CRP-like cAMP-binding protein